jgi:integrase
VGVYARPDSPFWWLLLERPAGQRAVREATRIARDGGSPAQDKENRRQAQALYAVRMIELARRRHDLPVATEGRRFAAHRAWYFDHVSTHKRNVDRERSMLKQLGAFFDGYALADIDQAAVREWRTERRDQVKASTITREEAILSHMLTLAVPKYLDRNPLVGMTHLRSEDVETRILTDDEERRLLAACRGPATRAILLCGLDGLMRRGSVAALAHAQDHGRYLTLLNAKAGTYKVPVSTRLRAALDQVPTNGARFFAHSSIDIGRLFDELCTRARVTHGRDAGGVTFHCLRHTGASRMLARGVDVKTVMRIGGWRSVKILERYLHPTDAAARDAVNTIGHASITRPRKSRRSGRKRAQ